MNGGAVKDERSPEKEAMDFRKADQEPLFLSAMAPPSFSPEDILSGFTECQGRWLAGKLVRCYDGFPQILVLECAWAMGEV